MSSRRKAAPLRLSSLSPGSFNVNQESDTIEEGIRDLSLPSTSYSSSASTSDIETKTTTTIGSNHHPVKLTLRFSPKHMIEKASAETESSEAKKARTQDKGDEVRK
jgi:hypothetical protein